MWKVGGARTPNSPSCASRESTTMAINESLMQHAANLDSINRSKALFFEADRLNDQAYALLNESVSTQTIHKFSAAKKRADEKYRQAWQEWLLLIKPPGARRMVPVAPHRLTLHPLDGQTRRSAGSYDRRSPASFSSGPVPAAAPPRRPGQGPALRQLAA